MVPVTLAQQAILAVVAVVVMEVVAGAVIRIHGTAANMSSFLVVVMRRGVQGVRVMSTPVEKGLPGLRVQALLLLD